MISGVSYIVQPPVAQIHLAGIRDVVVLSQVALTKPTRRNLRELGA
jgi:hypothetical protein